MTYLQNLLKGSIGITYFFNIHAKIVMNEHPQIFLFT